MTDQIPPARSPDKNAATRGCITHGMAEVETDGSHGGPLFHLGRLVITSGALALLHGHTALGGHAALGLDFLVRHAHGDWGELCDEDKKTNVEAVKYGLRIMSVYDVDGEKLWLITEADRSVTTFLLPSEY